MINGQRMKSFEIVIRNVRSTHFYAMCVYEGIIMRFHLFTSQVTHVKTYDYVWCAKCVQNDSNINENHDLLAHLNTFCYFYILCTYIDLCITMH